MILRNDKQLDIESDERSSRPVKLFERISRKKEIIPID